ncbi:MAG: imidazoleglycerol-phosphate dehydratase HisB [Ignavibacteriaceae bacterium]|nr:imidazoleglycerol-phosphate dehydratase HisB [Ignavibacteriaceae bacterium]
MFEVVIDKSFFNLDSPLSKGLISGLKKLAQRNFIISVKDFNPAKDKQLNKILNLEGIRINGSKSENITRVFSIAAKKTKDKDSILIAKGTKTDNFEIAVNTIFTKLRSSVQHRKTKETDIKVELSLDGKEKSSINTGIGFFDHMLEQIARHANINLKIRVKGDLHVDEHHTVEDVGITLGNALSEALGNKLGIKRYGFYLPMDDAIANCAIDLGGRAYLNFNCKFNRETVGEFPTELTEEFFRGLAASLKANVYIMAKGKNDHHKIEAIFKAFAKSLNEACRLDERNEGMLPSTKGIL